MKNKGFTLIEIIICVALLSAVALIAVVTLKKSDPHDEKVKIEDNIVASANVYFSVNSLENSDIIKETGRTFVTVGELVDNGCIDEEILNTEDAYGDVITRDSKIGVYLVDDDLGQLYFDYNGVLKTSLVVLKDKLTYSRKTSIKVKDIVYNEYLRAYDSNNIRDIENVNFQVLDEANNLLYDNSSNLEQNLDTNYVKKYKINYTYGEQTKSIDIEIEGKYSVALNINNTNKPNKLVNKGDNVSLTIQPNTNFVFDSSNFICKDSITGNTISFTRSDNNFTFKNVNTDIECTGAYKENVKYVTLNVTNGSIKNSSVASIEGNKVKVPYNNNVTIEFSPKNTNYTNSTVKCGSSTKYLSNNKLTLNNVKSDTTCNVTFSIPTYTLSVTLYGAKYNGKTTYSTTLEKGSNHEITISPDSDYIYDDYSCSSGVTFNSSTKKLTVTNMDSYKYCYIYYLEDNLMNRVSGKVYTYDNPVYIKYGNYTWIVYDYVYDDNWNTLGIQMVMDRTAGITSFSRTACCDTGVCTYANNNFVNNYIGQTVLTNFYNKLPSSRTTKLISKTYDTGYVTLDRNWNTIENHTSDRTATSVIGMLSYDDDWIVNYYEPFYENSLDKMTWTTYLGYQGSTVYGNLVVRFAREQSGSNRWSVFELVNTSSLPGRYFYSSYGNIYPPDRNYYYRPVIVMDKNVKVKSGEGTKASPYVVE